MLRPGSRSVGCSAVCAHARRGRPREKTWALRSLLPPLALFLASCGCYPSGSARPGSSRGGSWHEVTLQDAPQPSGRSLAYIPRLLWSSLPQRRPIRESVGQAPAWGSEYGWCHTGLGPVVVTGWGGAAGAGAGHRQMDGSHTNPAGIWAASPLCPGAVAFGKLVHRPRPFLRVALLGTEWGPR